MALNAGKKENKYKKSAQAKTKEWTLRDGSKTKSFTEYRKDKQSAPTRGDYDPKTKMKSKGKGY